MAAVLTRPTLVLNRNWQAVNVATVARAIIMLWNQTAKAVDPHDYQLYDWSAWSKLAPEDRDVYIQAVSKRIRVPEIVTLTEFDRVPSATVTFSRRNVFKRDGFACQYCGKQPGADELTIDHVVPRAHGGESSWTNCVLACLDCNRRKADRTPKQAGLRLRNDPKRPAWKPVYLEQSVRLDSWSKFISDAYWHAELEA